MSWTTIFYVSSGATVALLLGIFAVVVSDVLLWRRMPPGPQPLPFVGNKFDIPGKYPWIQFQEWSKKYGPIYTLWLGRHPTIIISDPTVAAELLEKRSHKYSSRPRFVVMGEIYSDNSGILVAKYGKDWSVRRKALHNVLTQKALQQYKPVQEAEATRLCQMLVENPQDFESLLDRFTASIVFTIAYGHRIDSMRSPIIRQRLKLMHIMASLNVSGPVLQELYRQNQRAFFVGPSWLSWDRF